MAKQKTLYVCSSCGAKSPKWQGKCFACGAFNSFVEEHSASFSPSSSSRTVEPKSLSQANAKPLVRSTFSLLGLDDILGGGVVSGQVLLLGGEPGVGKSTLLTQVTSQFPTIYVCGEESSGQVALRIKRLNLTDPVIDFIDDRDVDALCTYLDSRELSADPKLVIVDSIQSLYSTSIQSVPGSIAQVQYSATKLSEIAKKCGYIMVFVGQVTKSGYFAGPKLLEHIVDTVLFFEGDKRGNLRILRVVKNRFGSSNKVEIFIMDTDGLLPADTYLKSLIAERVIKSSGSALAIMFEGNRPLIIEIQALNAPSQYGISRRIVNGISGKRVEMLLAVLQRRVGISSNQFDIYINISGGLKVIEPGCDLAVMLAVVSVLKNKPLPKDMIALGEVGLLGEIKPINRHQDAIKEATKHGYLKIIDYRYANNVRDLIKKIFI